MRKAVIWVAWSCAVIACNGKTARNRVTDTTVPPQTEEKRATVRPDEIVLEKAFLYDRHTLADQYPYKDTVREFQWEKIKKELALLETAQQNPRQWAYIENRRNEHGQPPLAEEPTDNNREDRYGVDRYQGIPLYDPDDPAAPARYGIDGSLVEVVSRDSTGREKIGVLYLEGEWFTPGEYVYPIGTKTFGKVVVVDRTNQNITTLEKAEGKWLIRSMNPATTGLEHPPYQKATPLGIFVIQEKKERMAYTGDGSSEIVGFAPYASRFSNGGYIHGVPVNNPEGQIVEFSTTLGTTPRSHMCVRNASSHAKFVYDWAPVNEALVVVIE